MADIHRAQRLGRVRCGTTSRSRQGRTGRVNVQHPESRPTPAGATRTRAQRFYVVVAVVVLLAVGGYLVAWATVGSDDGDAAQSSSGEVNPTASGTASGSSNDPTASASPSDPTPTTPGLVPSQPSATTANTPGQSSASTTGSTRPANPSDPLQIAGCGAPPYPKTFEGWTGNPDYTNAATVVYVNGPISNLNRLGYEVSRVAGLGCVSVPLFGANQNDLSAIAWGNAGLFTKEQVIAAMSRIGMASIDTPACHPKCFK